MKTFRIELRYVGLLFIEADGVMESEFSITFHKNGVALASYPSYAVNFYDEVPFRAQPGQSAAGHALARELKTATGAVALQAFS
jgi:hypothetical protein